MWFNGFSFVFRIVHIMNDVLMTDDVTKKIATGLIMKDRHFAFCPAATFASRRARPLRFRGAPADLIQARAFTYGQLKS